MDQIYKDNDGKRRAAVTDAIEDARHHVQHHLEDEEGPGNDQVFHGQGKDGPRRPEKPGGRLRNKKPQYGEARGGGKAEQQRRPDCAGALVLIAGASVVGHRHGAPDPEAIDESHQEEDQELREADGGQLGGA